MTAKRFTDNGIEEIENQSFTDNLSGKTYWINNGLDEIIDLLNTLYEENQALKSDRARYEEECRLDVFRELHEENEQLKQFKDKTFNSLNGKIKRGEKAIEWGKSVGTDVGAMRFHIELLKQFKKKLEKY